MIVQIDTLLKLTLFINKKKQETYAFLHVLNQMLLSNAKIKSFLNIHVLNI